MLYKSKDSNTHPQAFSLLHLLRCCHSHHARAFRALEEFKTCELALEALLHSNSVRARYKVDTVVTRAQVEDEMAKLEAMGGFLLTCHDMVRSKGPGAKNGSIPKGVPLVVSAVGKRELLSNGRAVGIVGARSASLAGGKMATLIAQELVRAGFVTVSGLARGIDTCVHKACQAEHTIAVLANGVDVCYPPENRALQRAIQERGLVLSEMPLGCPPSRYLFPKRNRIISALALGVVVIEAREKSGSLITARYAQEQGRKVWAVPGCPLDPLAWGPNQLIKQGAQLVESAQDIIASLFGKKANKWVPSASFKRDISQGEKQATILDYLSPSVPVTVEDLMQHMRLSAQQVRGMLLELKLEGKAVERMDGFCRC